MLKKKILILITELVVILNHIGVTHLWRLQNQLGDPPTPSIFKNEPATNKKQPACKHVTKFKTPFPPHFYVDVISVLSPTCLLWYEFCFCFRKNYHPVVWTNKPIIKILLKDTSKPWHCELSTKVNIISNDILWNFMWSSATNAYYTKKKLQTICKILHFLKFQMAHVVIAMWAVEL